MPTTAKQLEKDLLKAGWVRISSNSGGHRQYRHVTLSGKVTIPWHKNGTIALGPKLESSIRRQAGI